MLYFWTSLSHEEVFLLVVYTLSWLNSCFNVIFLMEFMSWRGIIVYCIHNVMDKWKFQCNISDGVWVSLCHEEELLFVVYIISWINGSFNAIFLDEFKSWRGIIVCCIHNIMDKWKFQCDISDGDRVSLCHEEGLLFVAYIMSWINESFSVIFPMEFGWVYAMKRDYCLLYTYCHG
jgi:hypothetical protein